MSVEKLINIKGNKYKENFNISINNRQANENTICLIWQIKSSRFKTMLVLAEAQGHGRPHSMSLRVGFGTTILFIETIS